MEFLPNGYTLEAPEGCFPFSTDSTVLGHWAKLPKNATVLDLGSGCGTLGLLLCSKDDRCQVTGLEIDENAHRAAEENIRRNDLQHRMVSICTDLRSVSDRFSPGAFSCCVSNPPYFSGGPASATLPVARREDTCTAEDLFRAVGHCLKFGGDFYLVHRPERLAELITLGAGQKLEAKRLLLLRHKENGPIALILLAFRKGGKPGLIIEEQALFDAAGQSTPFYRQVYHLD